MPKEGIWIETPEGNKEFVYFNDIDPEVLPQIFKPIGGFCYAADDFVRLALPKVPFYLKDWLPKRGRAVIYAPPKSGKSFLSMQLARCIGEGQEFLEVPTTKGVALYIQFELGAEILRERIVSTGQAYDGVYVGTTFAMKLDTPDGQNQLVKALDAIEPNVLILDPFYKMLRGEENESHDVLIILDFLDNIIDAYECSVVIIHHTGLDLARRARGSSVIEGWTDSYIEMKKISNNGEPLKVRLTPKFLRHVALPSDPIEAVLENFEFKRTNLEGTIKDKVGKFIHEHREFTSKEIMESEIGSRKSIQDSLNHYMAKRVIERHSRGVYSLVRGEP